jgi:acid stress chaperone HdeB
MIKPRLLLAAMLVCFTIPAAQAQFLLDTSKVTCQQYVTSKMVNPRDIAIWVSGYFHGKAGNAILDIEELKSRAEKLRKFCQTNPQKPLLEAAEALFGGKQGATDRARSAASR